MGKKIIFKTASMIRSQQEQHIPEDVSRKIDDWIMSNPDNKPMEVENAQVNENISFPFVQEHKTARLNQENKTVRLNINISTNTHKEIKKVCVDKGISITDFVTNLLQNEIGGR